MAGALVLYMAADASPRKGVRTEMMQVLQALLLGTARRRDEEGQTLVEYGLLLALIAIVVIVALIFLGPIVSNIFSNVGRNLQ